MIHGLWPCIRSSITFLGTDVNPSGMSLNQEGRCSALARPAIVKFHRPQVNPGNRTTGRDVGAVTPQTSHEHLILKGVESALIGISYWWRGSFTTIRSPMSFQGAWIMTTLCTVGTGCLKVAWSHHEHSSLLVSSLSQRRVPRPDSLSGLGQAKHTRQQVQVVGSETIAHADSSKRFSVPCVVLQFRHQATTCARMSQLVRRGTLLIT